MTRSNKVYEFVALNILCDCENRPKEKYILYYSGILNTYIILYILRNEILKCLFY